MKRFLFLFLTVMVAVSLFIIPAAAADSIQGTVSGRYAYFADVSPGFYSLHVYTDSTRQSLLLDIQYIELRDGSYDEHFENLDSIFDDVSLSIVYKESLLQCSILGESDHLGNEHFDLFGSQTYPNVVAELVPVSRRLTFLESIGSFFTSSMEMLADVSTVVTSYPALLILIIGVVILGYIAFQIKRLM